MQIHSFLEVEELNQKAGFHRNDDNSSLSNNSSNSCSDKCSVFMKLKGRSILNNDYLRNL